MSDPRIRWRNYISDITAFAASSLVGSSQACVLKASLDLSCHHSPDLLDLVIEAKILPLFLILALIYSWTDYVNRYPILYSCPQLPSSFYNCHVILQASWFYFNSEIITYVSKRLKFTPSLVFKVVILVYFHPISSYILFQLIFMSCSLCTLVIFFEFIFFCLGGHNLILKSIISIVLPHCSETFLDFL